MKIDSNDICKLKSFGIYSITNLINGKKVYWKYWNFFLETTIATLVKITL